MIRLLNRTYALVITILVTLGIGFFFMFDPQLYPYTLCAAGPAGFITACIMSDMARKYKVKW